MHSHVRALWLLIILVLDLAPSPRLAAADVPRLVIVMSVDQLRYDYLERFSNHFAADGIFRLVMRDGASYSQCFHRHAFTVTGPGHSVMMTGTFPYRTGIIDNEWYDRATRAKQNCVVDLNSAIVGAPPGKAELKGVSPANLLVPTVCDVLRAATQDQAKVFGLTLKDRSAVLMSGHHPSGVYWFDANTGLWVTSRYYRSTLPNYMQEINRSDWVEQYGHKVWKLLYDPKVYHLNCPDASPFEGTTDGVDRSFPHTLPKESDAKYFKQLMISPFGNELTIGVAQRLIEAEHLGQDEIPDLLNLGLSSNDYVGHNFGPHSLEVEDLTYRTDILIGEFVQYLDRQVGAGKWTLFITADHGIQPIPEYAAQQGASSKRNPLGDLEPFVAKLEGQLSAKFGPPEGGARYIEFMDAHQIFLDRRRIPDDAGALQARREFVRDLVMSSGMVAVAFTRDELLVGNSKVRLPEEFQSFLPAGPSIFKLVQRSFHAERSGDVLFALKPFQIQTTTPAMHGSPWEMDSHVPLLALGCGIHPGHWDRPTSPAAIASTVARLLQIDPPRDNEELPLREALGD